MARITFDKPFQVSCQYGGGHHFFLGAYRTKEEADKAAKKQLNYRMQAWKARRAGAKPAIYIWMLQAELTQDNSNV